MSETVGLLALFHPVQRRLCRPAGRGRIANRGVHARGCQPAWEWRAMRRQ
jgi:hypothetical protein